MKPIFEQYKQVREFPRLTKVELLDDDDGWYIVKEGSMECLDIRFKNPSEARHHAVCEYLVIVF
jgi:hypothetical protein